MLLEVGSESWIEEMRLRRWARSPETAHSGSPGTTIVFGSSTLPVIWPR